MFASSLLSNKQEGLFSGKVWGSVLQKGWQQDKLTPACWGLLTHTNHRVGLTGRQPIAWTTRTQIFSRLINWSMKAREKKNGEEIVIELSYSRRGDKTLCRQSTWWRQLKPWSTL